ncbi:uncharacterized protein LOC143255610 isoform X4 [Tachypleus tridentatus]|uniref:uncharacterized protein LOC143255610 isoform X4 n=2 Tax=Tachypleus tridentatus TaxID=6853 RepID=UPI003FD29CAE
MFYFWWNAFLGGILFVIGGSDLRELCQSDEQCQVMSNNSGCKFDRGIGICTCQEGYEEVTTTKGKYCLLGTWEQVVVSRSKEKVSKVSLVVIVVLIGVVIVLSVFTIWMCGMCNFISRITISSSIMASMNQLETNKSVI